MSAGACCRSAARPGLAKRGLGALPWFVPTVLLALLPKCPACFAAWLALASGAGVSATTASHVRTALVVLCVGSALYAFMRFFRVRRSQTVPRRRGGASHGATRAIVPPGSSPNAGG